MRAVTMSMSWRILSVRDVVVLDCQRPVRREADFETGTDRATPAGLGRLVKRQAGCRGDAGILVGYDGAAAFDVPENVVPGVTDLPGEKGQTVDAGLVGGGGTEKQARIRSLQIAPIALHVHTEHP